MFGAVKIETGEEGIPLALNRDPGLSIAGVINYAAIRSIRALSAAGN